MALQTVNSFLQLTKPRVMVLVLAAGLTALVLEGGLLDAPLRLLFFLVGLYLTGGAANALNQYFERAIDGKMERTRGRRPLPLDRIRPRAALVFSVAIAAVGVLLLGFGFNLLTAALALATILMYSLLYTLYLKPRTDQNIVIGGLAGAMAPVGAWAAATGSTAVTPWLLCAIIFLWTPPHFWSLAIICRDDYRRAGLPMYPVTRGIAATLDGILVYTLLLVAMSLTPLMTVAGWPYGLVASALGGVAIHVAWKARQSPSRERIRRLFLFSLYYLGALFAALIIDRVSHGG